MIAVFFLKKHLPEWNLLPEAVIRISQQMSHFDCWVPGPESRNGILFPKRDLLTFLACVRAQAHMYVHTF